MEIYEDIVQGTPEWFAIRAGMPTASEFATVMAKGKGAAPSKTRRTYMLKLAGERLTGLPMESYSNGHMERGKEMEEEARLAYEFQTGQETKQVGFATNHGAGCSPDSLIDTTGMLEIKTRLPHLQLDVLLRDEVPSEHAAQVQGQLWVCEREWVDFVSYWPRLPLFVKRVFRDDNYIKKLAEEVARFNEELDAIVARFSEQQEAA